MTTSPDRSAREFPAEPWAVRAAREFVVGSPASAGVDRDALALAVSELASNVVLHANTRFVVLVEPLSDGVRVSVTDGDPSVPRLRDAGPESITGRGLMIVESLSRRLRIDQDGSGKTVWFELGTAP